MKLGDRLQALADFVPQGSRVADIGTDHGYLAVELVKSGKAKFVVASDKNAGPYEAAVRTVRENGLTDERISVRLGDGLKSLKPGEVDTVCIAGMGGTLMVEILEGSPEVVEKLETLVLQPQSAAADLRRWLYRKRWYIEDESLALDDSRIYEIIKAKRGRRKMPEPLLLEIGPVLWQKKPPLLRHHIEALLFQERRVAAGMEKSERAKRSTMLRIARLSRKTAIKAAVSAFNSCPSTLADPTSSPTTVDRVCSSSMATSLGLHAHQDLHGVCDGVAGICSSVLLACLSARHCASIRPLRSVRLSTSQQQAKAVHVANNLGAVHAADVPSGDVRSFVTRQALHKRLHLGIDLLVAHRLLTVAQGISPSVGSPYATASLLQFLVGGIATSRLAGFLGFFDSHAGKLGSGQSLLQWFIDGSL